MSDSPTRADFALDGSDERADPEPLLASGARVAGAYEIRGALGQGAFAMVYDAIDTARDRQVAIKVLHVRADTPVGLVERFRREARLSTSVRHPHVLEVYETGALEDGSPYLVMERLNGETLAARIARRPLPLAQVVEIGCQLLCAVEVIAAAGIVHRDIKPDNVMMHESDDGPPSVKLVDFGISKRVAVEPEPRLTSHGALVGTPQYMSPEQIRGEEVDVRTDLYAVGAVLYEALTGKAPHESSNFSQLVVAVLGAPVAPIRAARPDCPLELEQVILRALSRTPQDRHGSPREFLDALEHVAHTFGLPRGDDAFRPGDLDIGALVVADSMRTSIVGHAERRASGLRRRRPMQLGLMAALLGLPAFALHVYGASWLEPSERVLAQRDVASERAGSAVVSIEEPTRPATPAIPQGLPAPAPVEPVEPIALAPAAPKPASVPRAAKHLAAAALKPAVEPAPLPIEKRAVDVDAAVDTERDAAVAAEAAPSVEDGGPVEDAAVAREADAAELSAEPADAGLAPAVPGALVSSAQPATESGALPRRTYKQVMEAALAALVRGRLVEAATRYNEAVRLDPREPSGFRGLGLVAARLGNYPGARWALSRYLLLAPKAPDAPAIASRIAALPR